MSVRPFTLERAEDVSGVSGTGTVAEGVEFTDGTVVLRWRGERPSTVVWASLADAMAVHGHDGRTTAVWADGSASQVAGEFVVMSYTGGVEGGRAYNLHKLEAGPYPSREDADRALDGARRWAVPRTGPTFYVAELRKL